MGLLTTVVQEEPATGLATGRASGLASVEARGAVNGSSLSVGDKGRSEGNDGGGLEHHLGGFEGVGVELKGCFEVGLCLIVDC
jgi:hypothetical protein